MNPFDDIGQRPYGIMDLLEKTWRGVFNRRFWEFCLPYVLLGLLLVPVYISASLKWSAMMMEMWEWESEGTGMAFPFDIGEFISSWFLVWALGLLGFVVLTQYVLRRMKLSIFAEQEHWLDTLRESADPLRLASFLVTGLAAALMIWAGCLACLLPGVFLMIVFWLLPPCLTFHPRRFNFPISEPFTLMSGRFWVSAGALSVPKLAYLLISWGLSFIMFLSMDLNFFEMQSTQDPQVMMQEMMKMNQSPVQIIGQLLSMVSMVVFYIVMNFLTTVLYFNLKLAGRRAAPAALGREESPRE